jgi:hypothetical protein
LRLDVPIAFKRRGVITDHREHAPRPDTKLVKTVAQGREWFGQVKNSQVPSVRSLSKRLGLDQGDLSRILPLGLLAPDIVEAILAGRHPIELTASRLRRLSELPISWQEQRRVLGFG